MFSYDSEKKVLSAKKILPIYGTEVTLGGALIHAMRNSWNWLIQESDDDGIRISNREMTILGIRAAQNLTRNSIGLGDVVGIIGRNSSFITPIILGAFIVGAPVSPLDPIFSREEIQYAFGQSEPKIIFCDADFVDKVTEALDEIGLSCHLYTLDKMRDGVSFVFDLFEKVSEESWYNAPQFGDTVEMCAAIIFTSGTTGLPKGVKISHAQLLELQYMYDQQINTLLCMDPIHYISGFSALVHCLFRGIRRIVTANQFSPKLMLQLVEKYEVDFLMGSFAQMQEVLLEPMIDFANLNSVKVVSVYGGTLYEHIRKNLEEYFISAIVLHNYGITEAAFIITTTSETNRVPMSVGKPVQNMEIKIADNDGVGLGIYKIGEIFVKPLYKFMGYVGNQEASSEVQDEEGWLHSGDLGYYDEELNLFVVDRKKDIINYFGRPIAPSEIENLIINISGVKQVCVVGIPDILSNDLTTALIVKHPGSPLLEDDVSDECSNKFPEFKHLHGGVFFTSILPMTYNGKVKRKLVKEIAISMYLERNVD